MLKLQLVTCHGPFLTPLLHIHWLQSSGGHLGSKHWMTELKAECCVPQDGRRKAAQPPVALARSRLSLFDFVCTHQLQMGQWISPSGFFLMQFNPESDCRNIRIVCVLASCALTNPYLLMTISNNAYNVPVILSLFNYSLYLNPNVRVYIHQIQLTKELIFHSCVRVHSLIIFLCPMHKW